MIREGFKKIAESGGSYVTALFFNPETGESYSACVRDYDYYDGSRDDDEAYNAPIDEDAMNAWKKFHGIVRIGDTVKVVKGRKVPLGTVGEVKDIYDWRDCYGRIQCIYVVLDNGQKTNINNVAIV